MKIALLLSAVTACAVSSAAQATTLLLEYTPTSIEKVVEEVFGSDLVTYRGVFAPTAPIPTITGAYDSIQLRISAGDDKKFVLRRPVGVDGTDYVLDSLGLTFGFTASATVTNGQSGGTNVVQGFDSSISFENLEELFPTYGGSNAVVENGSGSLREILLDARSTSFSDGVAFSAIVIEHTPTSGNTFDSDGSNLFLEELVFRNSIIELNSTPQPVLLTIESTVVPLPAGVLLLGGALGALAMRRKPKG